MKLEYERSASNTRTILRLNNYCTTLKIHQLKYSFVFRVLTNPSLISFISTNHLLQYVGNKAKGRIPRWVLQENKARQIFRKTNISYPLIRTHACELHNDKTNLQLHYAIATRNGKIVTKHGPSL